MAPTTPGIASAAIACLALSGCISFTTPPLLTDAPVDDPFVLVRSIVDLDGGQGEPSLGVTPDGVLWTNGAGVCRDIPDPLGCLPGGSSVYRSDDDGHTWTRFASPVDPMIDADPDLAVDVDGTVWYNLLYAACVYTATSRDNGETWVTNPAACEGPGGDRQYVVPTRGGTAYLYYHQLPTFYQTAVKTTDYGATWVPMAPVEFPDHHLLVNGGSGWGGGGFWNQATGSVFLTFTWNTGGLAPVRDDIALPGFAVTRDGTTWETGVAATQAWGQSIGLGLVVGAADDAGNIYIAWGEHQLEGRNGAAADESAVFLAGSKDDGRTWTPPLRVNAGPESIVLPAIAAGADGHVAVAYYQATATGDPNQQDQETLWDVVLSNTTDFFGGAPFSHARLNEVPVRNGSICAEGSGCLADREFLDYFALERLPDGRVAAVYNAILDPDPADESRPSPRLVNVYAATRDALLGPRPV